MDFRSIYIWFFVISECSGKAVEKQVLNCGDNERPEICGNLKECEGKCSGEDKICSRACYGPKVCVCEEGFFRDDYGNCVEEEECDDMEIITFAPN
ncbi:trypsin Inhibitor like cysteine rich domain protein [Ancylostoma caninum]|uniref:Trypsin Inhibitor like cysteine rich domain protein n=1 Tax=Ancylostoma caninum TaxID=29170 RepID=A0A368FHW3_ANCCA|nr:trypsin Inhibitor like cysteine rich domain protein [Ancylostoma caninum]